MDLRSQMWIFAAGGLGASLRALLATAVELRWGPNLPYVGILCVNLLGCFAIGLVFGALTPGPLQRIVVVGLLGGFTTYATFAQMGLDLAAQGKTLVLLLQLAGHLVAGTALVWLGRALGRAALEIWQ